MFCSLTSLHCAAFPLCFFVQHGLLLFATSWLLPFYHFPWPVNESYLSWHRLHCCLPMAAPSMAIERYFWINLSSMLCLLSTLHCCLEAGFFVWPGLLPVDCCHFTICCCQYDKLTEMTCTAACYCVTITTNWLLIFSPFLFSVAVAASACCAVASSSTATVALALVD